MIRLRPQTVLLAALAVALALAGCALPRSAARPTLFDLGPQDAPAASTPALPPIAIADVLAPPSLDRVQMFYRLDYVNPQQPHPYAQSRWSAPPAQLLTQRIKSRIARAGGTALPATDGATQVPELRIEADEFSQHFPAPNQSTARVSMRASLYRERALIGQTQILREIPAPTPDAEGGARALAVASDAAIDGLIVWLAAQPLQ